MNFISQKLDLRHSQNLVMTPQLQQAIKLLQLNNVELSEFIDEEIEKNPLLERAEGAEESVSSDEESAPEQSVERDSMEEAFDNADAQSLADFDAGSSMMDMGAGGNSKFDIMDESFESRLSAEKTLREHLSDQVYTMLSDERDILIAAMLIDRLDESGYLREGREELLERLGCSAARLDQVLATLKTCDPTGVFAADLSECLALQLEEKGALDAPMRALLAHLQMIADHDFRKLADVCGVNETYLFDMIEEIKGLNPKPASEFEHLVVQTAIPDVLMKRLPKNLGGGWRVELNADTLPRVLINQTYYTEVNAAAKNKDDKEFLSGHMQSAHWLMRALDQRAQTILKVAAAIVEEQDAFFNYGIEFLRPLTLKDVAEMIDMHESTVSRVTTNKYIGTPRGIFELKFFFTTALVSADGVAHSSEAIKARLKALIDAEDPAHILSDDTLVDMLSKEGIDLARRTVAKYREGMNIGSSVLRRKQKKITQKREG